MHSARVDHTPAIAKIIAIDTGDEKAAGLLVLQDRHAVDLAFQEQIDRVSAKLRRIEANRIARAARLVACGRLFE